MSNRLQTRKITHRKMPSAIVNCPLQTKPVLLSFHSKTRTHRIRVKSSLLRLGALTALPFTHLGKDIT